MKQLSRGLYSGTSINGHPNSEHLPNNGHEPCINHNFISYCYNTKPASHKQTPLYTEKQTTMYTSTNNGLYKFAEARINHAHRRRITSKSQYTIILTDEEQELRSAAAIRTKDQELQRNSLVAGRHQELLRESWLLSQSHSNKKVVLLLNVFTVTWYLR